MRKVLLLIIFLISSLEFAGQDDPQILRGKVSYMSSKNIYVTFNSTEGINVGDTLYTLNGNSYNPVLIVKTLSSLSCLCESISSTELKLSEEVIFKKHQPEIGEAGIEPVTEVVNEQINDTTDIPQASDIAGDTLSKERGKGDVSGRFSVSSYSTFNNTQSGLDQRMRYVFSMNAKKISGSRLSFESYLAFRHGNDDWDEISNNFYNGLKVYNLSLHYNINETMNLWFGRKINPKLSSMGAIDGLQYEHIFGSFTLGIIAGSHPDWEDYSYNPSLFQAGAFVNHKHRREKTYFESTVAYVDQKNDWKTDRRFLYVQHLNSLFGKLYFFGSGEFDLYMNTDDTKDQAIRLTNLYVSMRYKVMRELSFSVAYSARNNIILYETYKTYIDRLLEMETLQGFIVGVNTKLAKFISIGLRGSYRYRKSDIRPSRSLQAYANFMQSVSLPLTISLTSTYIETSYIKGREYGARFSRDIIKGLYAAVGYRNTHYDFYTSNDPSAQNCFDVSLNYRGPWALFMSANYEGVFDKDSFNYNRIYVNLTKRF